MVLLLIYCVAMLAMWEDILGWQSSGVVCSMLFLFLPNYTKYILHYCVGVLFEMCI